MTTFLAIASIVLNIIILVVVQLRKPSIDKPGLSDGEREELGEYLARYSASILSGQPNLSKEDLIELLSLQEKSICKDVDILISTKGSTEDLKLSVVKEISNGMSEVRTLLHSDNLSMIENNSKLVNSLSAAFEAKEKSFMQNLVKEINENEYGDSLRVEIVKELKDGLGDIKESVISGNASSNETMANALSQIPNFLEALQGEQKEANNLIIQSLSNGFLEMKVKNQEEIKNIREQIDTQLSKSLGSQVNQSFDQISQQLERLHDNLAMMKRLEQGVSSLDNALRGVKTRGNFGEGNLRQILEDILPPEYYRENVRIGANIVEFGIRLPQRENGEDLLLPIDAKFPLDVYEKLLNAQDNGTQEEIRQAQSMLRNRVKEEAKKISEKYIFPNGKDGLPFNTTDLAIMFLPTEGLYAEVLRLNGIADDCRRDYKVLIAGPTNTAALLNSLSLGFKYLRLSKSSDEALRLMQALKAQLDKFDEQLLKANRKIEEAQGVVADVQKRNTLAKRSIRKIESMSAEDSDKFFLGLDKQVATDDANKAEIKGSSLPLFNGKFGDTEAFEAEKSRLAKLEGTSKEHTGIVDGYNSSSTESIDVRLKI